MQDSTHPGAGGAALGVLEVAVHSVLLLHDRPRVSTHFRMSSSSLTMATRPLVTHRILRCIQWCMHACQTLQAWDPLQEGRLARHCVESCTHRSDSVGM